MEKILVLGNNGYVGSLLTEKLLNEYNVTGVDLCLFGPNLGRSIISDTSNLTETFLDKFDTIICLAAHSSVQLAKVDPKGAVQNNVVNLNMLMHRLKDHQKLIYASSASVYGSDNFDATEDQDLFQMSNTYDITKQTGDELAKFYIKEGKRIVGLRFGTVCGISNNTRTDLAINNMMLTASRTGKFWIANQDVSRSFLSVNDAVDAIYAIIKSISWKSGLYNVKSFDCVMRDVAIAINEITGYNYDILNSEQTSYDFTINISKISDDYGWKPKFSLSSLIKQIHKDIDAITECRRDNFEKVGEENE